MTDILHFYKRRGHDKSATVTLRDDITEFDDSGDAANIINKLTVVGMGPGSTHLVVTVEDAESQEKYNVKEGLFSAKDIHDIDLLTSFANATLERTKEAKHRMTLKLAGSAHPEFELGDTVHVEYPDAGIDGNYRIISVDANSGVAGDQTKLEVAMPQFRMTGMFMEAERRLDAEDYHPQGAPSIIPQHEADNVDSTHSLKMKFYVPEEAVDMGKLQIKEAKVALTLEPFRAYSTGAASGGGHTSGASSASTTAGGGGQTTSAGGGQTTSSGGGQTSSGGSSHSHSVSGQTAQSAGDHYHWVGTYGGDAEPIYTEKYFLVRGGDGQTKRINIWTTLTSGWRTKTAEGSHSHSVTGTTSASESSHTHTVSDHTHSVSDHTHSVSDHTHGMQHTHQISNHTHNIVYGIYTSTYPTNVYIKLNGAQIAGPFNADENIDITTEFLNQITTYGWNTLEFTSTQLGRIGATLFMRLFLQAS